MFFYAAPNFSTQVIIPVSERVEEQKRLGRSASLLIEVNSQARIPKSPVTAPSNSQLKPSNFTASTFSPPRVVDDLADGSFLQDFLKIKQEQSKKLELSKKEAANRKNPTTPQTPAASTAQQHEDAKRKVNFDEKEQSKSEKPQQPEKPEFIVHKSEKEFQPYQDSSLSAELNPGRATTSAPPPQLYTTAPPAVISDSYEGGERVNVCVFVPTAIGGLHKVDLILNSKMTGHDLIIKSLEMYRQQTGMEPVAFDSRAYILRVANEDGNPDLGWPELLKNAYVGGLPCDQVVLVRDSNFRAPPQATRPNRQVVEYPPAEMLGDVRIDVVKPNMMVTQVSLSPDVVIRELLKVLCARFELDPALHELMMVDATDDMQPIPKQLRDRYVTLRTFSFKKLAIMKTREAVLADDKTPSTPDQEKRKSVVLTSLGTDTYTEFRVVKINKFGKRQERRLGFTSERVYNRMPSGGSSLFNLGSGKTKHPERPLENLKRVEQSIENPRCFQLEFVDETLYYEAKTQVEAEEIVKKLSYFLELKQLQNDIKNKRLTMALGAPLVPLSSSTLPPSIINKNL